MHKQLHPFFKALWFSPLDIILAVNQSKSNCFIWVLYLHSVAIFLNRTEASERARTKSNHFQTLFLPLCSTHRRTVFVDWFFFLVNLSFRFDPATYKKKVEKKAFSEIKQLHHKMFFSKNNTFPQTLEAELCIFSSPISESKMLLPPLSFCPHHVCVAWRFVAVVSRKIKWQQGLDSLLDQKVALRYISVFWPVEERVTLQLVLTAEACVSVML